jgi:hypothetical protein
MAPVLPVICGKLSGGTGGDAAPAQHPIPVSRLSLIIAAPRMLSHDYGEFSVLVIHPGEDRDPFFGFRMAA